MIQVFKPYWEEKDIKTAADVLRSGWWGLGEVTERFEEEFSEFVRTPTGEKPYCVAVNSCTSALQIGLHILGLGMGMDVIVPPLTFVSTAHAVRYLGANVIFGDLEEETLCLSPESILRVATENTVGVIPVHYSGYPAEMRRINKFCDERHVWVLEDCAHAVGAFYYDKKVDVDGNEIPFWRHVGTRNMGAFSFHPVKNLATLDGGMLTFANKDQAEWAKRLRWLGIDKSTHERSVGGGKYKWKYKVTDLGYKSHPNDLNSAIGLVQLGRIKALNEKRRKLAEIYMGGLAEVKDIRLPAPCSAKNLSTHHFFYIRVGNEKTRNALNLYLGERGVATGVHYVPINTHPYYRELGYQECPVAEREAKKLLTLPSYAQLKGDDIKFVVDTIRSFFGYKKIRWEELGIDRDYNADIQLSGGNTENH
jgi:perosamine synthetase